MSDKCHWLPCSIDHDGLAPVNVYFRPELISNVHEPTTDVTDVTDVDLTTFDTDVPSFSSINPSTPPQVYAASFRGRSLIAAPNDRKSLPKNIVGCVMMPTNATTGSSRKNECYSYDSNNQHHDGTEMEGLEDHNKIVVMKEQFNGVLEWEHESDERKIIHEIMDDFGESGYGDYNTQTQSSVGKGIGLLEILHCVHDPIPI